MDGLPRTQVSATRTSSSGATCSPWGDRFPTRRVWAFDKSDLYAGNPVTAVQNTIPGGSSTPQPLNLHGFSTGTWPSYGNDHYILVDPYDGATYTVLRWDIAGNSLTTIGTVNLVRRASRFRSPRAGAATSRATTTARSISSSRNGSGWMTQTVGCNPGSGTVNCVRSARSIFRAQPSGRPDRMSSGRTATTVSSLTLP